jgi:sortase (surface protein transpeptidase)
MHGTAPSRQGAARLVVVLGLLLLGLVLLALSVVGLVTGGRATGAYQLRTEAVAPATPSEAPRTPEPVRGDAAGGPTPAPASPPPAPTAVRIPAIGVDSRLVDLALNADGTLQVPSDPHLAGWYVGRPVPGEPGPAVIVGHVDSETGPAVFYALRDLGRGDRIEVERADGSVVRFTVVAREQHDKDSFPTRSVYGPTSDPELRLITCGGRFDRDVGHYTDNVIVYARLQGIVR